MRSLSSDTIRSVAELRLRRSRCRKATVMTAPRTKPPICTQSEGLKLIHLPSPSVRARFAQPFDLIAALSGIHKEHTTPYRGKFG